MRKTRILLIEDNRILRDGIKAILNKQADLRIVASTGGNHDTLLKVRSLKPQVVLINLGLRNENGLRVVATLTREFPHIKVIGMGLLPSQLDFARSVRLMCAKSVPLSMNKNHLTRITQHFQNRNGKRLRNRFMSTTGKR